MRALICGSRDWTNSDLIWLVLDALHERAIGGAEDLTVIHGACNTRLDTRADKAIGCGADAYAHEWCFVHPHSVGESLYPADWERYGKRAGFVRNAEMLADGKPDVVVGFTNDPPSAGTRMMLDLARRAGVPTYRIQEW